MQLIGYDTTRLAGSYILANTINLAETGSNIGTAATSSGMWAATGFVPIGTDGNGLVWNGTGYSLVAAVPANAAAGFSGFLYGNGYAITNLAINRATAKNIGLFGLLSGTVSGVDVAGAVTGQNGVGGLVGMLYRDGLIEQSRSAVNVAGNNLVGGLVGNLNDGSNIRTSSASGSVTGISNVGGLAGYASNAAISRSFATGVVNGANYAGGLIGYQYLGTTSNSYATGRVSASANTAGGLIGYLYGGSLTNSYATGQVNAARAAGGLTGQSGNGATVTSSYWNTTTSGQATSASGTGLTTEQMEDPANYSGWDFLGTWTDPSGGIYPIIRPFMPV